ncbi:MAG TPA: FmdE family protein [Candidatus Limnocylindrales bacterium]
MNDNDILTAALVFHGHKCWASTAGVRLGLAAMGELGVDRAGSKQLHAIIETGDHHGGMCFGDGVQFTTGCTFGKGNIEKSGEGKFAVTLIDKATKRAVRVAYRPTLQPRIKASPFMQKRAAGVPPTDIPEAEQMEVVNLVWDAPADEVMTVGPIEATAWSEPEEIVRFLVCPSCGELVAEPYARVAEGKVVCPACSGYPR